MSQRQVVLLLVLLLLPTVAGHAGEDHLDPPSNNPNAPRPTNPSPSTPTRAPVTDDTPLPSGYTGPGSEPYRSYFEGTWLYGQASVSPIEGQSPVDMDHDGDWIVWEDAARSDIYAFSVTAGQGYYLTNDSAQQHRPKVAKGIVVWEDYRDANGSTVWMYDLHTSETRRLSLPIGEVAKPQTDGAIVVWTWLGRGVTNVHAYTLANSTEWVVAGSRDREQDPFTVGGRIYWRALRFNVWDILGFDTRTGEHFSATNDRYVESAPFGNGTRAYYLSQSVIGGWSLHYYDTREERDTATKWNLASSRPPSIHGEHLLLVARDVRYQQLVVRNLTNSVTTHVTGNLLLATEPVMGDGHIYAIVRTARGMRLLDLTVSPFAFATAPKLFVTSDTTFPWIQPLRITGKLEAGPAWTAPLTFTYRVDGGAPQPIPANTSWAFTLDNAGVPVGFHSVTIRATFREGPPVTESFILTIPKSFKGVDLPATANAYHEAVVMSMARTYVIDNPGAWVLIPLIALMLLVVLYRLWLWRVSRGPVRLKLRRKAEPEYVRPELD